LEIKNCNLTIIISRNLLTAAKNDALKKHLTETCGHVAMHLDQAKKLKDNS